jgi:hypothetical protein
MGSLKRSLANNILTSGKFDATDLTGNLPSSNIANESMTSITAFPASAGSAIALVASDPPSPTLGDVWFNTTSNALKYAGVGVGSWATGGNLNVGRASLAAAASATQTASLFFGGNAVPYTPTEEYNGTSFSSATAMGNARYYPGGLGTQTAAAAVSGFQTVGSQTTATEEYDGSTWTAGGAVGTARYRGIGAGIQTAGLFIAGSVSPGTRQSLTEEYDGTSWTAGGATSSAKYFLGGAGTQTAGLNFGGSPGPSPSVLNNTEEYDGTSWTAGGSMVTAISSMAGGGLQTAAISAGGYNGTAVINSTQTYDGTSWSAPAATLPTTKAEFAGHGPSTAAFVAGGGSPSAGSAEYTKPPFTNKTVTTA